VSSEPLAIDSLGIGIIVFTQNLKYIYTCYIVDTLRLSIMISLNKAKIIVKIFNMFECDN
jgi:hypothetical protein